MTIFLLPVITHAPIALGIMAGGYFSLANNNILLTNIATVIGLVLPDFVVMYFQVVMICHVVDNI